MKKIQKERENRKKGHIERGREREREGCRKIGTDIKQGVFVMIIELVVRLAVLSAGVPTSCDVEELSLRQDFSRSWVISAQDKTTRGQGWKVSERCRCAGETWGFPG